MGQVLLSAALLQIGSVLCLNEPASPLAFRRSSIHSHEAEGTHRLPLPTSLCLSLFLEPFFGCVVCFVVVIYNLKTPDSWGPASNLKCCATLLPFAPEHPPSGGFLPSPVMGPSEGFTYQQNIQGSMNRAQVCNGIDLFQSIQTQIVLW